MATTTQNLGLIEPAGTDHALVSNINTNSDKIDAEAGNVRGNFALVQNGDTATQAISKDQLVVWKGVLKKATANISSGATLSSSNLSDDTIAAELAALNSNIANFSIVLNNISGSTEKEKIVNACIAFRALNTENKKTHLISIENEASGFMKRYYNDVVSFFVAFEGNSYFGYYNILTQETVVRQITANII